MTYDRRLIEDSLPLEVISEQSAREKRIRSGHISTLHIWWARRPLAAMRAVIFASLIPAPKDDAERDYLHKLIADIVNWDSVKNGNSPRIEEARALIRKHYPDAPPKVLDPFMGGGSTGLEALRLGANAYGVELNPIAYIIQLCTLVYPQTYGHLIPRSEYEARGSTLPPPEPPQTELTLKTDELVNPFVEDFHRWAYHVFEQVSEQLAHLYANSNDDEVALTYHWVRTVACPNPNCRAQIPLSGNWWLSRTGKNRNIALKPLVNRDDRTGSFVIDHEPADTSEVDAGTMSRGTAVCLVCSNAVSAEYLRDQGQKALLGTRLVAVGFRDQRNGQRRYRIANYQDVVRYQQASSQLAHITTEHPDAIPSETFPLMSGCFNIPIYGPSTWGELFNPRQLVAMHAFSQAIRTAYCLMQDMQLEEEYARALATCLSVALDRLAVRMAAYCIWDSTSETVMQIFNQGQSLPMRWDHVEMNPILDEGSGWLTSIDYIEKVFRGSSAASLLPASLHQGTATRLPLEDSSLDGVITDPPYYDAVPYADLSDFFYVWQSRTIRELWPQLFVTPLSPKSAEITQMSSWDPVRYSHKTSDFYEAEMTKAFLEIQRCLKANALLVLVFAHTSTSAWEKILSALLSSGMCVTASWPLHTESPNRLRAQGSAALASSIFIVCRKRTAEEDGFYDDVRREMRARIKERLDFFWNQGIRGADFFISAIGPAVEVFGRYRAVRKLSGEIVTVAALLDMVQEAVADYTLSRVLNGRYKMGTVDAPTRFYVMYRWSYGGEKLLFDDARRLAQALGAEVSELTRSGILKQSGDSVTMPGASERRKQEHLGEAGRDGTVPPVIDVLHRAVLVWQEGDRRALAEYLAQHALGREEEVNAVAQAIVNVLPQGDRERQLLENYLQGSGDLPRGPQQGRLF